MLKIFNYPIQKVTLFFEYIGQYLVLMSRVFRSFESWPDYFSNTIDQIIPYLEALSEKKAELSQD